MGDANTLFFRPLRCKHPHPLHGNGRLYEDYVEGSDEREGLEIEDPGEAIQVMNAIEKNRKLIIDDTEKLSQISENP